MKKLLSTMFLLAMFTSCGNTNDGTLSKQEAADYSATYLKDASSKYIASYTGEWDNKELTNGEYKMPFWYNVYGPKAESGYPMYISMHGGGGAPKEVNDQQWENQKRLYGDVNGIYWVPRAPTDAWDLWHQGYMEEFLLKAVTYAVNNLGADPDKIYIMGYSAGGDGTFNLAPRLADRFAAAAMMAGHPGDAEPKNLRNIPFAIYMGGEDGAYNRNGLAAIWGQTLDSLQKTDPKGFIHKTTIYEGKGHWMDREDKEALTWLPQFERKTPDKIVWIQDDVLATRKYNLEVASPKVDDELVVSFDKNTVTIEKSDYDNVTLWFNDEIVNLDEPVKVIYNGKTLFEGELDRTKENIEASVNGRYDERYVFPAKVNVSLK